MQPSTPSSTSKDSPNALYDDLEKHVDQGQIFDATATEREPAPAPSTFEKKTMLWVDLRILPIMALLYTVALVDRLNIGVARAAGMGDALGLDVGARYSIATCMYFVPYILFQVPTNLLLRKIGVRSFMTFIVTAWGAVSLATGYVKDWKMLTMCRVFLGAMESGLFPAMVYIIPTWYRRHETQKRMAAFYMLSLTMSGFSPILAYCISLLDGKRGIAGWSWIFIIEGSLTMFLGIITFFFVPDFPDRNKFLTAEQTALVLERVERDRGDSLPDPLTKEKVLHHLTDWTIWTYGIMLACSSVPSYMLAYFIPIILGGMGYGRSASLLLSAPPYGPAFATALIFGYFSDRLKHRSTFIIVQALICIVGCCLTAFHSSNHIRYFGTFLINIGSAGAIPGILAYGANNVVSQSKRSVQSALTSGFAGIGGIIASTVFRQQDHPRYVPGLWVTIGTQIVLILVVLTTVVHFSRLNRLSRAGKLPGPIQGQPGFYHTL